MILPSREEREAEVQRNMKELMDYYGMEHLGNDVYKITISNPLPDGFVPYPTLKERMCAWFRSMFAARGGRE